METLPLRVLHYPDMVGGHPQQLARAERECGLHSWSVALRSSKYQYASDEVLSLPEENGLVSAAKRLRIFRQALAKFDVIHFNFGKTFFPQKAFGPPGISLGWKKRLKNGLARCFELRDLALLKRAGKGIVVTFQGSDARQGDIMRTYAEWNPVEELEPGYYTPASDAHKRWRIRQIAKYADIIYGLNPDLMRVLPARAKFLPYAHVDLSKWTVSPLRLPTSQAPLVLHAPTHRGIKGTRHVLDAVRRLQSEGVAFRFDLVEGLTQAQAKERYRQADLLVDQLLLGWYGGLAVELMALGKPVIGFIRQADLEFVPRSLGSSVPVIQATPASVYAVLKEWLTVRREELAPRGLLGRQFVEKWHDPKTIAAAVRQDYYSIPHIRAELAPAAYRHPVLANV